MAIEIQPEQGAGPGGGRRRTRGGRGRGGAPGHPHRARRRGHRLLPRPLARQRHRPAPTRPAHADGLQRLADRARLRVRGRRLAGRARRVQRPAAADGRPAGPGARTRRRAAEHRAGQVLPVLAGPQGRRHPVPGRHDRLLLHGRPVRHGDQDRTAVADLSRLQLPGLRRDRRRARHDDDDDDDLGHPRAVRQLPGAADDRLQAGGVPADRGAVVLADAVRPS